MTQAQFGFRTLFISAAVGFLVGGVYTSSRLNRDGVYRDLAAVAEAMQIIHANHVSPPENRVLLQDAIAGMVVNLDEYSEYLDPETLAMLDENTEGYFVGIGIEVAPSPKGVAIVTVFPNSPAEAAKIQAGDIIQVIDGKDIIGLPLDASISMIRGEIGSTVRLSVLREDAILDFYAVRSIVEMEILAAELLQGDVGWLRLYQFTEDVSSQVRESILELESRTSNGLQGLILDMRGNPGGLLHEALRVVDLFLDEGTMLSLSGVSQPGPGTAWNARRSDTIYRGPMVTLVDRSAASASEVVAGSLQDNERSLIVGQTSFGKGSVQAVIPLRVGGALKITTSHYLTPSGRCIHREGIKPDVVTYDTREADANPHLIPRDVEIDAILAEDDMRERERIGCTDPKLPERGAVHHLDVARVSEEHRVFVEGDEDPSVSAALSVLAGHLGTTAPYAPAMIEDPEPTPTDDLP